MAITTVRRVINLEPGITAPLVIHVSQYDTGREINLTLYSGSEKFVIPSGTTITVHGTRKDGGNFGPFVCTYSGSEITFTTEAAMTASLGSAIAEIVLVKSGEKIGSANFAIYCEESAFPNGVTYDNDPSVYEDILFYVQNTVIPTEAITIDDTLSHEGAVAEAKATGDAIAAKKLTIVNGIISMT